jgi:hypothetical protein
MADLIFLLVHGENTIGLRLRQVTQIPEPEIPANGHDLCSLSGRAEICGEAVMKKDNQLRADVRKSGAPASQMGDPKQQTGDAPRLGAPGAGSPTVTISARYINSRLKQFCSR